MAISVVNLALVLCLIAATHAAAPRHAVQDVKLYCQDRLCTSGSTGDPVGWKYGRSRRGGTVNAEYLADGSVRVVVTGFDEAGQKVDSRAVFADADLTCVGAVSADGSQVTFDADVLTKCGFRSELGKTHLHRTGVIHVVHTFGNSDTGAVIVGAQHVKVSFTLVLNDPDEQVFTPEKPDEDADVAGCIQYTHMIEAGETLPNCFNATIKPDNYDPDNLGIGFEVVDCNLHFAIENLADPTAPPVYTTLDSSPASFKFIEDGETTFEPWIFGKESIPGKSYSVAWRAVFPLNTSAAHPPRFECSVCLCSLEAGSALKRCTQELRFPRKSNKAPLSRDLIA